MNSSSASTSNRMRPSTPEGGLRHVPVQARSRERLRRVLGAADEVLATDGAAAFTTNRIATVAGVPVGSVYHYFPDKAAVVEALAVMYWQDLADLVAAAAERDERSPLADPAGTVIDTLAAGFRARPGFLALWYGGLRTEAGLANAPYDVVIEADSTGEFMQLHPPEPGPWAAAGATWWIESWWTVERSPDGLAEVRRRIEAGPPS